jgi:hypothetical protein
MIPKRMEQPGLQGNELQVVQGLIKALQRLTGGGVPIGRGRFNG